MPPKAKKAATAPPTTTATSEEPKSESTTTPTDTSTTATAADTATGDSTSSAPAKAAVESGKSEERKVAAKSAAKKGAEVEEKDWRLMLGRPGNSVSIGLVGLPNVGKSSLFNLLSGLQVPAENYPFCTIKPSTATVPVPDARYDHLKNTWKPKSQIQAVLTVTDIAGLVKGAAEGKGLGNAFLSNIQAVDAIYHVTRGFLDAEVEHVEGSVDPARDFDIIKSELIAKDLAMMEARVADLEKKVRQNAKDRNNRDNLETARKVLTLLQEGKEIRFGDWKEKDIPYLNTQQLLTAKPVVYLINVSEKAYIEQKSKFFKEVKTWVDAHAPGDAIIPFSVAYEQKLQGMSEAERKAHIESTKAPSRLDRIITAGYKALGLIQFFTTGVDEVRSWTIRKGTKAPGAGGVIHSDFDKGFICAEIYNYDDFKELGSESAVKAAGRCRTQGKEYVMKDGDVVFFKANRK